MTKQKRTTEGNVSCKINECVHEDLSANVNVSTVDSTKKRVSVNIGSNHTRSLPTGIDGNIAETGSPIELCKNSDIGQVCETVMVNMLYVWNVKTSLISDTNKSRAEKIVNHEAEFTRIKEYLMSRIDARTALQRYPSHYDIPLLSPEVPPPFSVTNRLVNFFVPARKEDSFGGYASGRTTRRCHRSLGGTKNHSSTRDSEVFQMKSDEVVTGSASSIVFVGPFDPHVVRHDEYVRRRITAVLDSIDDNVGDVCYVTDIGQDVQLTRMADIVGTTRLRPGTSIRALTGVDPQFNPASVVLLLISTS